MYRAEPDVVRERLGEKYAKLNGCVPVPHPRLMQRSLKSTTVGNEVYQLENPGRQNQRTICLGALAQCRGVHD